MQPPSQTGGRKRHNLTLDLNSASAKKSTELVDLPGCSDAKTNLPGAGEVLKSKPDTRHPNPKWLYFPQISYRRANDVCQ